MATELGAKCSFIEPDQTTMDYVLPRVKPGAPVKVVKSDSDAKFAKTFCFDVSKLEPQVCFPPAPDKTHPIRDALGIAVDQVCLGTCTGGSIYDFREAAKIIKGREVKAKTLIVPSTREVYNQCEQEGLMSIFLNAGCVIYPAYCGTCQALSVGHIAPGETQMHCGPRNWPGRMAEGTSTYLASPATCAATAVEGRIADPRNYL
jgi:3-isopropylmalate/(R)-2-methylmalate dehydratase large subunit